MEKNDPKSSFNRWVLLLQVFYFVVKDRKENKNKVANHLSKLEEEDTFNLVDRAGINDTSINE